MFIVPAIILMTTLSCWTKDIVYPKSKREIDNAIKNNKMVIVDYFSKTCGPCQQVAKYLPDLAKEFPEIQFVKVDVYDVDAEDIRSVPTFIFYNEQKQVKRFTGSRSKSAFANIINDTFCLNAKK